jgi:glyoxylase-like metal-dependent hydrolase (beta-lactamase superfamily II)
MELERVSDHAWASISPAYRFCDANAGFVAAGPGVVVDTLSDLAHARALAAAIAAVFPRAPGLVVNTHEDLDHVFGNQVFDGAEVVGHRSLPARLPKAANPNRMRKTMGYTRNKLARMALAVFAPGALAAVDQLGRDYDFTGIELVPPTRLVDDHLTLDLDGLALELTHVGPAHQEGDLLVHLPAEDVLFAGDIVFKNATPIGWRGTFDDWRRALATIEAKAPARIVPGHGPVCGLDGVADTRAYIDHVEGAARPLFDAGVPALEAAKRIPLERFAEWHCPARLYANLVRAYRGFRGEAPDASWDFLDLFNGMHKLARTRKLPVEY